MPVARCGQQPPGDLDSVCHLFAAENLLLTHSIPAIFAALRFTPYTVATRMLSARSPTPVRSRLPAAMLLAASGGLLDAVTYLNHGHVFANAMTGNFVLLGVALAQRNWFQAMRHTSPVVAFAIGVLAARRVEYMQRERTVLAALGLEIIALFVLGLLPPSFPELLFTGCLSFVSAFQVSTFHQIDGFPYSSTFVTGNLREAGNGLFDSFAHDDPGVRAKAWLKFRELSSISFVFLMGAVLGGFAVHLAHKHALWFAEPLLLGALAATLIESVGEP
jgi:uncharacterized membrane protein YoaK (UPF0700 family)